MALVPHGKTEWQDLGSLGRERRGVGATPAKRECLTLSLKEVNPTLQALKDTKEEKKEEKVRPTCFFFFWLHHKSSLTRDGTCTHPLHWELRVITTGQSGKSHMFLFLLLGLEKGSPGLVEPSRWMGGRQGSWNILGDISKQEKPLR